MTRLQTMTEAWVSHVFAVLNAGREVSPRGKRTLELPQHTVAVDMRYPVLLLPTRKLSYQFMAAEASWILSGSDRVEEIAPWNKRIADFSDDGETFFGAYGPKVLGQLDYVVKKLLQDPDSRQAGLTIWRENPPETKDVPCTVAMFFALRDPSDEPELKAKLEASVFMRSNDVWLGTPYDVFNFSMVAHLVCARLNSASATGRKVEPGALRLTAASSHLYEEQWPAAREVARLAAGFSPGSREPRTPELLFEDSQQLRRTLMRLRDTKPGDALRWWEAPATISTLEGGLPVGQS